MGQVREWLVRVWRVRGRVLIAIFPGKDSHLDGMEAKLEELQVKLDAERVAASAHVEWAIAHSEQMAGAYRNDVKRLAARVEELRKEALQVPTPAPHHTTPSALQHRHPHHHLHPLYPTCVHTCQANAQLIPNPLLLFPAHSTAP